MFNNIISNIYAKMPTGQIPMAFGSISGGLFGRELLIKNLSLDTKKEDSNVTVALKTVANLAIRSSSIAFSPYNPFSLPYFTLATNPLIALGKGYQAYELYTQGKAENDKVMIDEAKKKTLEVAKHVAFSVFDYGTLGFLNSSDVFDLAAIAYTGAGALMDVAKKSKNVHEQVFDDPDYTLPDDDDSDDEDSDSLSMYSDGSSSSGGERDVDVGGECGDFSANSSSEFYSSDSSYVEEGEFGGDGRFTGIDRSGEASEALAFSEDDEGDTPAAGFPKSPVGINESRFVAGVIVNDDCRVRRTPSMQLRDNEVLRRPLRFFSP